jgi:hypothetical protein
MNDELVVCARCGCSLPRADSYTWTFLAFLEGRTRVEFLCSACWDAGESYRFEAPTVREPAHGAYLDDNSIVRQPDWDRDD